MIFNDKTHQHEHPHMLHVFCVSVKNAIEPCLRSKLRQENAYQPQSRPELNHSGSPKAMQRLLYCTQEGIHLSIRTFRLYLCSNFGFCKRTVMCANVRSACLTEVCSEDEGRLPEHGADTSSLGRQQLLILSEVQ